MKTHCNTSEPLAFASVMAGASRKEAQQNASPKPWSDSSPAPDAPSAPQRPYGYMRQKELMTLVPFSPATLWRLVKAGKFVRPVKLSARITAWNRAEVFQWFHEQGGRK